MYPLFATGVIDTGGKFAAGVIVTGGKLPPVSLIPVVHLYLQIFPRSKKFETVRMGYSGAGGKLIHEKKTEATNLVTLSL